MLLLTCYNSPILAQDETLEAPDMAFLEYLAGLQQVDGKWLSPVDMLSEQQLIESALPLSVPDEQLEAPKPIDAHMDGKTAAKAVSNKIETKENKK